jgi:hypothetical protein
MFLNQIAGESNPIPERALEFVRSSGGRERKLGIAVLMGSRVAVRASGAAGFGASAERFVDNGLDGARASATLGAAAEATIDLLGITGKLFGGAHGIAHIVVAEDVAGADNHENGRAFAGTPSSSYLSIDK